MDSGKFQFFETHPIIIYDYITSEIYDVNDCASSIYGFPKSEFIGKNISDLGEKLALTDYYKNGKASDALIGSVWKHKRKDGSDLFVQLTDQLFRHKGRLVKLMVVHDVTDLVKDEVRKFNRYPQLISDTSESPLTLIEWGADKKLLNWSESAEKLFEWEEHEMETHSDPFKVIFAEDEYSVAIQDFDRAASNKSPNYVKVYRNVTESGNILFCEWYNTLLYDQNDNLVSVCSLVHDITDRKESEHLFKVLTEESLVGVYLIQNDVFKYINPRFAKIFNYKIEEIEDKLGPLDLTHPDDKEKVRTNIQKRLENKQKSIEYNIRCLTKDNQEIYVNVYGTRINYMGKPAVIGTLVDITANELAIQRYKASVESYEDLFDSISDAIFIHNEDGTIMEVNEGVVNMYGYEKEHYLGRKPVVLAAPGKVDMKKSHEYFLKALQGEPQSFNWWGKRKNGEVFPKEIVLNPGTYFGERVVIAIARDITERYIAEEELRKNEELFRQLFQNAPIGIAMMDKHQEIQFVNNSFEQIFGYPSDEIRGLDIDRLIVTDEYREEAENLSKDIFSGSASGIISRRKRKDGTMVDVIIYGVPVIVESSTIAIFGIYVDITDRKRAEEQVRKSLKEKEVLLAEIHHRVKNNLAVITGLLELQSYNADSEKAKETLKESQMRIHSIALIHEKLYQSEDLSHISFSTYIKELSEIIVSSLIKEKKKVDLKIDSEQIGLTVNQAIPCGLILNELITNSFKHAFDGMDRGTIRIGLEQVEDELKVTVEDNGVGLPDSLDLDSPSTLGMTLIETLSRQLEGEYAFRSNGEGTHFSLRFRIDQ